MNENTRRRELREKAKQAGKSAAGTVKEGAQRLKEKARTVARDEKTGIEISEVRGQYLVVDGDGNAYGPYDDKKQAAGKARELRREQQGTQARERRSERSGRETTQPQGREGRASSEVSQRAQQTTSEPSTDNDRGFSFPMMGGGPESGPELQFMGDVDNDGDPELAFFGDVDNDGDRDVTLFEPNEGQEPTLPGFDVGDGEPEMPTMFGGGEGGDGPQIPGFGFEDDSDDDTQPWMF